MFYNTFKHKKVYAALLFIKRMIFLLLYMLIIVIIPELLAHTPLDLSLKENLTPILLKECDGNPISLQYRSV